MNAKSTEHKLTKPCLICAKVRTLRKGLCPSHYAQYARARELAIAKGLDADQFDADLIVQGLLAIDARAANNPFATALAKFEAKSDVAEATAKVLSEKKKKP